MTDPCLEVFVKILRLPCGTLTLLALGVMPLQAQERTIQRTDLPPAVAAAAAEHSRDATVLEYSTEREAGQTFYEMALRVRGHHKDILFDTAGAVVEIEEQVALESLSASVRTALESRAGGATIRTVEALTKQGRLVAYEAQLSKAGQRSEIQVGPMGETLDHEE